jgi:hypothetical protein
LNSQDQDLGSAAPVMIPRQSNTATPLLALQGGKDKKLRLLNRQNLSGLGGPNHVGGELQTISTSCQIFSQSVAWQDNSGTTWIFVSDTCSNLYAFKVVNANNQSTLQQVYKKSGIKTSPFIAGGVLFGQIANAVNAFDPTTGNLLWTGAVGAIHWQSPIAINGRVFDPDDSGNVTAFSLPGLQVSPTPTSSLSPTPTSSPSPTPTPPIVLAQDTFNRPNQTFWGTASDGHTWGGDANSKTSFSINNNTGKISVGSTANLNAVLGSATANAEILFSGSLSIINNQNNIGAVLRWTSNKSYYRASITGSNFVLQKNMNSTVTKIKSISFSASANTSYTIRFNIVGTTLSAKVWKTGTTEPTGWMITATDSSLSSGQAGLRVAMQSGTAAIITSFIATAQ